MTVGASSSRALRQSSSVSLRKVGKAGAVFVAAVQDVHQGAAEQVGADMRKVVEAIAGKTLDVVVKENITGPLDLNTSGGHIELQGVNGPVNARTSAPAPVPPEVEALTQREREVIEQLCLGKTNQQIADSLFISLQTVKDHTHRIYTKVGINSRMKLVQIIND